MRILFIDTETTGLKPQDGQIIEITGIIVEFNPNSFEYQIVDSFDSTVSLRGRMEDKITRITGITEIELATAPNLRDIQEKWAQWLEQYQENIVAIVGHSIDFDLGFLKFEKWFLPENYHRIDTLNLCKIYLPHYSAINLEFLIEKLALSRVLEFEDTAEKKLTAHRSFYDTRMCVELFVSLIKRIESMGLPINLQNYISKQFLPLPLVFYPKLNVKLKLPEIPNLDTLLSVQLPEAHSLILAQKLVIFICETTSISDFPLKFHSQGKNSFVFGRIVDQLLPVIPKKQVELFVPDVPRFESILTKINTVLEQTTNVSQIVETADWLWQIHENRSGQTSDDQSIHPAILPLQKLMSSYEFFIFSMNNVWQKNEYKYEPATMRIIDRPIYDKFNQITELIDQLKQVITIPFSDIFSQTLAGSLHELISMTNLISDLTYTFRFFKNNFTVSQVRRGYTLAQYVDDLFMSKTVAKQDSKDGVGEITVETFLSEDDFDLVLGWLGIREVFNRYPVQVMYQVGDYQVSDELITLGDFFSEKLDLARSSQKPILMLCGQNSTLKDSQKNLTDDFKVGDYLLLGESGSLTKIGSKLVRDFTGLLVTKMTDYGYFQYLPNVPEFAEIWLLNPPYLWVHPSLNHVDQLDLKRVYLNSQLNFISHKSGRTVHFLRGYR